MYYKRAVIFIGAQEKTSGLWILPLAKSSNNTNMHKFVKQIILPTMHANKNPINTDSIFTSMCDQPTNEYMDMGH